MLRLNIVTPERSFLQDDCFSVTVPGGQGEMQIMAGHVALLSELSAGVMSYQKENQEPVRFMVGEGIIEVDRDQAIILYEQARHKGEIDEDFEKNLLSELKDQIKRHQEGDAEQKRVFAELARCAARLSLFD